MDLRSLILFRPVAKQPLLKDIHPQQRLAVCAPYGCLPSEQRVFPMIFTSVLTVLMASLRGDRRRMNTLTGRGQSVHRLDQNRTRGSHI